MIKKFNIYNESVRAKMTPKSEEEIWSKIKDKDPNELLKLSVKHKLYDGVKIAIDMGADVEFDYNWSIGYACMRCPLEIVKLLVENGADIHARDDISYYWASVYTRNDITEYLDSLMNDREKLRVMKNLERHRRMASQVNRTNESLRDKMTPKSKEEVGASLERMLRGDYDSVLKKLTNIMNLLGMEYPDEIYVRILDEVKLGLLMKHLRMIIDSVCNTEFSRSVVYKIRSRVWEIRTHEDLYDLVREVGDKIGDVYYRDEIFRRLIKLSPLDRTKEVIRGMVVDGITEGVRAKMTPKSDTEIKSAIVDKFNIYPELGYFNPFEWGFTIDESDFIHNIHEYNLFELIGPDGRIWVLRLWTNPTQKRLSIRRVTRDGKYEGEDSYSYFADDYSEIERFLEDRGYRKMVKESVGNKSVRDLMTPKPERSIRRRLSVVLFPVLERVKKRYMEHYHNRPDVLGEMVMTGIAKHVDLDVVFEDGKEETYEHLRPMVREVIEGWLRSNFPRFTEEQVRIFWTEFNGTNF